MAINSAKRGVNRLQKMAWFKTLTVGDGENDLTANQIAPLHLWPTDAPTKVLQAGDVYFDATTLQLYAYDGTQFKVVGGNPLVTNLTTTPQTLTESQSGTLFTLNKADGIAIALPAIAAADVGVTYTFVFETSAAGGNTTITAQAADLLIGGVVAVDTDTGNAVVFDDPDGTDDLIITFNGTTTGGLIGTAVTLTAVSATKWLVQGHNRHSGAFATAFS